jgi:hypothetical protein
MTKPATIEPEIKVLRAKARDQLPDCVIEDESLYDTTNDDGEKIKEHTVNGPDGTSKTIDSNMTRSFQAAVSTTGDVDMLVLEAELKADDDHTIGNPHVPITTEVRDAALERITDQDLEPAWSQ